MAPALRVVVADDSPAVRHILTRTLEAEPDIRVVRAVGDGAAAVAATVALRPDVLTLDLDMPGRDGLGVLERVMAEAPLPVVLITGVSRAAAGMTERALEGGAVDFILKYTPGRRSSASALRREIVAKVRAAARVRVIPPVGGSARRSSRRRLNIRVGDRPRELVLVGASTGGPLAVRALLSALPPSPPFPVVIVQHIPAGFTALLADQLDRRLPFPVFEARDGDFLAAGIAFVAPGDRHLLIRPDGTVSVTASAPVRDGHRPSADVTFQSAAMAFGSRVTGIILSGMGDDGTRGLATIAANRGTTYVQAPETCVVESMPRAAIAQNIVQRVGSPDEIGRWLLDTGRCP